ncbi:MAG: GIY-YIG nuclease family protein [Candidatus Berkelbacteria bacterium]|nr:GIY-YIG nuclease family protein [Candidatus Berkelbacteria bacterium]
MINSKDKIKDLPKKPGVYRFLDEKGGILYVGKAKNLQNRLKQYFLKELGRGPAIEQMVEKAFDIKYIETGSEIEAVLLEAELINKLKPKYNVRLKDDKSFLVIKIAKKITKTAFPVLELVRVKNVDFSDKSADYFGPYPAGLLLKKSIRYLRKIFPFRDCTKTKYSSAAKKGRSCIYGDIKICTAPCVGSISAENYNKNIKYLKAFLRGKKQEIIRDLEKEMTRFSKKEKFEEAAIVRNKLYALQHISEVVIGLRDDVFDSNKILFKRIECYDIANIGDEYVVGSMVVFVDGRKASDEYRKFKINNSVISSDVPGVDRFSAKDEILRQDQDDTSLQISPPTSSSLPAVQTGRNDNNDLFRLKQVLERRFRNDWPKPDLIVIDGGEMQLRVAKEVLSDFELQIPLVSISKGPKRQKNDFHFANSEVAKYFAGNISLQNVCIATRDEAHRFAISFYRKLHREGMIEN